MLTKFWEGLGGKLAEQWAGRVLTPAFIFWAGGLAAWVWGNLGGDIRRKGWKAALDQHDSVLRGLPAVVQVSLLIAVLIGLVASALIAERITLPLVRLLEGYWPGGQPRWFRNKLIKHNLTMRASVYERMADLVEKRDRKCLSSREYSEFLALKQRVMTAVMPDRTPSGWLRATWNNSQHKADRQRLEVLTAKREGQGLPAERLAEHGLTGAEETNLSQLEQRLRRLPVTSALMMPTRLGNVLRAAEERPRMKYGLVAVVCWPHLWMVLDKDAKDELTQFSCRAGRRREGMALGGVVRRLDRMDMVGTAASAAGRLLCLLCLDA